MARYKVLEGRHTDSNGKDYQKGEIIESTKDLMKIFQNKFVLVSGDPAADISVKIPAPAPILPVKIPIAAALPNVKIPAPLPVPIAPVAPVAPEAGSPLGTDITDRFPAAIKAQLKVFRKGKDYFVTEVSDIAEALNDTPLNKIQVDEFVKAYDAE